ncbi:MAG: hypothetical protein ACKV22_20615 [Bryobacteraceae bacterium]
MTDRSGAQTRLPFAWLVYLAVPGIMFAQSPPDGAPPSPTGGEWRRAAEQPQRTSPVDPASPATGPRDEYGEPVRRDPRMTNAPPAPIALPPQLTLRRGTFVTVRVDQPLSSDRNHQGDTFSATLVRPVVVDGVVVAERGQTLAGLVDEAQKAGRVQGVSRLAVRLTDLTLADGRQVPIQTQFVGQSGPTSEGRDAGAIATTTGMGATIGAVADWGRGAAIGAGVGAVAGAIGVLLTRGHESIIYPESVLTFRLEAPVTLSTEHAPQAFRPVDRDDYDRPNEVARRPTLVRQDCGPYGCPAPYFYGGPAYPYFYGPGFGFYYGPRYFYGGRYYHGRGYYGRRHR